MQTINSYRHQTSHITLTFLCRNNKFNWSSVSSIFYYLLSWMSFWTHDMFSQGWMILSPEWFCLCTCTASTFLRRTLADLRLRRFRHVIFNFIAWIPSRSFWHRVTRSWFLICRWFALGTGLHSKVNSNNSVIVMKTLYTVQICNYTASLETKTQNNTYDTWYHDIHLQPH